ncbi:MAG TPA: EAL domain-containing protein [Xanthomonadaceae bacterium]|nr:EAL domain-containing protein [Xanthomonadaceae bacterium]
MNDPIHAVALLRVDDGCFVEVNEAFQRASGYPRDLLIGRSPAELGLWAEPVALRRLLAGVHRAGRAVRRDIGLRNRAGEIRRGSLRGEIIDESGERFLIVTIGDIARGPGKPGPDQPEDFRAIFENSTEGMYRTSLDGHFIYGNAAMATILGYDSVAAMIEGVNDIATQVYADPARREQLLEELRTTGRISDAESQVIRPDGSRIWISENGWSIRNDSGEVLYFAGSVVDVTARREAEERYRSLFENAIEGVYRASLEGRFLAANPSMARILGFDSAQELMQRGGVVADYVVRSEARQQVLVLLMRKEQVDRFELEVRRKDGDAIWVALNARLIRDGAGQPQCFEGTFVDITEQRIARDRLRHAATHDPLTGLPNRRLFIQRLEEAIHARREGGPSYAVLFVDLDEFKVVNDSLGHVTGDELLVDVAGRLDRCMAAGEIVARHGGDEFTILVTGEDSLGRALEAARQVLTALAQPFDLRGQEIYTNASIGIVTGRASYRDTEAVLRDADTAMYQAKGLGRGCSVLFDQTMHDRARARLTRETELRRAIDNREFTVHYQPIVELDSRRLAGFEALVRWRHPGHGLLLPEEFIPLAEETGLTVPIGWFVLREACCQLRGWRDRHPAAAPMSMSVNLTDRQFLHPGLMDRVLEILGESGVEPAHLRLEILETVFMGEHTGITRILDELHAHGIGIHLDDFGTQYSSLGYLSNLPVDVLKIDRSFVCDMMENPRHRSLVRAILQIARDFGMSTIAEGVDTEAQAQYLLQAGCPSAQGFLFSRPLPAAAAEQLLADGGTLDGG